MKTQNTHAIFNKEHEIKKVRFRIWRYYNAYSSYSDEADHMLMVNYLTTLFPKESNLIPEELNIKAKWTDGLPETIKEIMIDVSKIVFTLSISRETITEFLMSLIYSIQTKSYIQGQ